MSGNILHRGKPKPASASAIVIVLMIVVLFSALALAFFAKAQLQRQISYSSAGQARADLLAHMGLETIKGELLEEIRAGSTISISNNVPIYLPITNFAMVPQLVGNNGVTNLVKISTSTAPAWRSTNFLPFSFDGTIRAFSGNSTTNAARGGRTISLKRWLKPEMLGPTETNLMPAPDWIIVTREGPVTAASIPTLAQLSDRSPSSSKAAIGRYAYTIYDEGGLLDINIAGYPSTGLTTAQISRKGFLALADLTQIPNGASSLTTQQVNGLIAWRNEASRVDYFNYLQTYGATNGFSKVASGDQKFVSRRDLIRYAKINGFEQALPYLSTFSRDTNAPSWYPRKNAADLGGSNGSGNIYAYKDAAENASAANRNLLGFRASDGTPYLKKRFPLGRLSLFGDPNANAASILLHFGLTKISSGWRYNHGASGRILTLDEVAKAGRDPDFFELLKAGILNGSIGLDPGSGTASLPPSADLTSDAQILQIGVNIIDQYDSDNNPTTIIFSSSQFFGIEDLPYLQRAITWTYEEPAKQINMWLQPEVWRPYQSGSAATVPRIRARISGSSQTIWSYQNGGAGQTGPSVNFSQNADLKTIEFDPTKIPRDKPVGLTLDQGATSQTGNNIKSGWPSKIAAFWTGGAPFEPVNTTGVWVEFRPGANFTLYLEWLDDSTWRPHTKIQNFDSGNITLRNALGVGNGPVGFNNEALSFIGRPDPRTDRFGGARAACITTGYTPGLSLRPDSAAGFPYESAFPGSANFSLTGGRLGLLSDNKSVAGGFYKDPDGVVRRAAGAYVDGSGTEGYPLIPASTTSRPVILNRPFQSVAEIGYAYRDLPYKELDFFTKESADAALLDLFCIHEEPALVSGRVSLNTRRPEVVQAILSGAGRRENDPTAVLSQDSSTIAAAVAKYTKDNGPFFNRSDFVTEFSDQLTASLSSTGDKRIKSQREAAVRALNDVSTVRTWNLLVDVITQSGKYATNSQSLNDFIVEGEKRYWLHVSIDRFTGQILDQQYEAVDE